MHLNIKIDKSGMGIPVGVNLPEQGKIKRVRRINKSAPVRVAESEEETPGMGRRYKP
jgi:hypothetical protein